MSDEGDGLVLFECHSQSYDCIHSCFACLSLPKLNTIGTFKSVILEFPLQSLLCILCPVAEQLSTISILSFPLVNLFQVEISCLALFVIAPNGHSSIYI